MRQLIHDVCQGERVAEPDICHLSLVAGHLGEFQPFGAKLVL